jgi:hypothetical protein
LASLEKFASEPPMPKPAKAGKNGRRGRQGKAVQNDSGIRDGNSGDRGQVAFCVYRDSGMIETAGFIYRLAFGDAVLDPRPTGSTHARTQPWSAGARFVYGQGLLLGPVAPVNTGGLTSPESTLECEVLVADRVMARNTQPICFHCVEPAKTAQLGRLPAGSAREVQVVLPQWGELGPHGDAAPPPWGREWSPPAEKEAMVLAYWAVGGVPFWNDVKSPHSSSLEFRIRISPPVALRRRTGVAAPTSVVSGDNGRGGSITLSFTIENISAIDHEVDSHMPTSGLLPKPHPVCRSVLHCFPLVLGHAFARELRA